MKKFKTILPLGVMLMYAILAGASSEEIGVAFGVVGGIILIIIIGIVIYSNRCDNQVEEAKKKLPKTCVMDGSKSFYYDKQLKKIFVVLFNTSSHEVKEIPDFEKSMSFVGLYNYFAVDKIHKKVVSVNLGADDMRADIEIIPFGNINGIEIFSDGLSVFKKEVSVTGTLVGGALLGGAGAVIGGLSGDTRENKTINSYKVVIYLKDVTKPIHTIELLPFGADLEINRESYDNAKKMAESIKGVV